jgi:hypothetical protein
MEPLDDAWLKDTLRLRTELKGELRMLHWLQLENQYAFVRESAMRGQPALAPLLRLMDAKLSFLAEELLHDQAKDAAVQTVEMSATGVALDWPRPLPSGSLWLVRIDPAGTDAPLSLPAVIQRLDSSSDRESSRVVLEFFGLTEEETDAIASWIVARQARCLSRRNSPGNE